MCIGASHVGPVSPAAFPMRPTSAPSNPLEANRPSLFDIRYSRASHASTALCFAEAWHLLHGGAALGRGTRPQLAVRDSTFAILLRSAVGALSHEKSMPGPCRKDSGMPVVEYRDALPGQALPRSTSRQDVSPTHRCRTDTPMYDQHAGVTRTLVSHANTTALRTSTSDRSGRTHPKIR